MKIESIRLKNFKTFRDVHLTDIPPFLVVVGANGSGKSTLFDVFGFLHDCLKGNVRQALDKRGRFKEVLSRDVPEDESILIEIQYRMPITDVERLVTYSLEIAEQGGLPFVKREVLRYKRGRYGSPYRFLDFTNGSGFAITNEEDFHQPDESLDREHQTVAPDTLAIKGLGQFERFKAANAFRQLIESWHVSDFHITAARGRKEAAGDSEHLSETGDNLPRVALYLHENFPKKFQEILQIVAQRVPGVSGIEPRLMDDGYLTLRFQDGSFKTPFLDRYVSDGTIKMFAYLVLLHDPAPHPLLCVEEPENQLYPKLMAELAEEFRLYSTRGQGQVLVSTHSPDFLNALNLEEVCWLVKSKGTTEIRRAKDDPQIAKYMSEGDQLGYLWKQGFFEGADPQ
ncbi:AAA family ATPase [Herbaspirillum rubrisubalbicans]|uniref:Chromosome segregation protein SMC n=1 Tax=Herbaspirillum rubrisubalbicans TaxID=80842 RepID=A0AAD0UDP9_9BURK|nr:AAA family ATPase [Herbaspirillum rubrisubalbicans]ALU88694.1 putative ATPase protein [Herbaspirillum rubrisubalbicans M1]AYR26941.1 chromosome segregation protein SMC [Herbaspirillum rubrisubalbicans]